MVIDNGESTSLTCNVEIGAIVTWIQTVNKTGLYFVGDNRTSIINNGTQLMINNINLNDEEYYGCGILKENNSFQLISSYFIYVRGNKKN